MMQEVVDETPIDIFRQVTALACLYAGDPAAARAQLEPLAERTTGHEGPLYMTWQWPAAQLLVQARLATGDKAGADKLLAELHEFLAETREVGINSATLDYVEAQAFALSGDKAKALERLRGVVDSRRIGAGAPNEDPAFAGLLGDSEFEAIMSDYRREQGRQRDAVLEQLGISQGSLGVAY